MGFHQRLDETRWKRVEAEWRDPMKAKMGMAFEVLRAALSAAEYDQVVLQWKRGERDIWLDNGYVMMCFTPGQ